jgi:H+-transporting ATPase
MSVSENGPAGGVSFDLEAGLRSDEILSKASRFGYNEIAEKRPNPAAKFFRRFWGVTPWMLEMTIVLEWLMGKVLEMVVVLGLLVFNAVLGFVQEEKANAALESLKSTLRINVRVKRDGDWATLPARELFPGDIVRLRAGDFVPADVQVMEGSTEVDQSSLTGESRWVERKAKDLLFSGSFLRRGEITGGVVATGLSTYYGKTVDLVRLARPRLHLEEITSRVVKWLMVIVGTFLSFALFISFLKGINLLGVLPLAVVLLVSAIPVALPTMFTVSMALGSRELLKKGVLVTRLSAIEDAATMSVLCADKTGTLTMNRLSIQEAVATDGYEARDVILYGALASQEANRDPIDQAFLGAARDSSLHDEKYKQRSFVPFDPSTRRTEAVVEREGTSLFVVKGAVNAVLPLCRNREVERAAIEKRAEELSLKGYRAIAVAKGFARDAVDLVGIAFLYDKPRVDSAKLIRELRGLGLSVKLLTGDALPIAKEVAREVDLEGEITRMSDLKLQDAARTASLAEESHGFAEVFPEDKHFIVKVLQERGRVVGMTGDGVNDAPALRQAEVGIAVSNATDVAKKAASAVLTTEGLEGIVDLVKIGRATYQRIVTWVLNKILKTFQISVFVVLAFLITGVYVTSALHMILLLFLTDFVTLSLSTDNVRTSPKPDTWQITGLVKTAILLGVAVIIELMILLFSGASHFGLWNNPGQLHTFTFQMLIYIELLDLLIIRERRHFWNSRPSRTLLWAVGLDLTVVLVISTVGVPGIEPIPLSAAAAVAVLSFILVFLVNDAIKVRLLRRFWRD